MIGIRRHKDYVYPLEQRAATLWYHDHRMDFTGPQVWRGLAGFHIVRDDEEDALPLPKGEKDVPLMICDRSFGEDGSFLYPSLDPSLRGNRASRATTWTGSSEMSSWSTALPGPSWRFQHPLPLPDPQRLERPPLRARARSWPSTAPFRPGGQRRGAARGPISHRTIPIAPAERFDVVIDFSKYPVGTKVTLKNRLGDGTPRRLCASTSSVRRRTRARSPRLSDMAEFEALDAIKRAAHAQVPLHPGGDNGQEVWAINGKPFDPRASTPAPAGLDRDLGADPAACTTRSTSTWSTSRCSPVTAGSRCPTTPAGRTPWTCDRARRRG